MIAADEFVPFALPDIGDEEIAAATASMRSGWLTTGPSAAAFERDFAAFIGDDVKAVSVNSATAGLHLALEALGIGPGDEVIVPTWTFTATAEVVRYLGAHPVIVDVDPQTFNIDVAAAKRAITPRTKGIMPVHFAGLPVSREAIAALASKNGLVVVEDAAHALPTWSAGQLIGAGASDAVVFSFYATKTITTGEGGMVVTRHPEVADRISTMRLHGINRNVFDRYRSTVPSWHYDVVAPGFKYNLTDPAAAMGRVQLRRAHEMRDKRAAIAARYDAEFADLPIELPAQPEDGDTHAWHLYVVRTTGETGFSRDTLIERLSVAGVGTSVHFIPLHRHPYWRETYGLVDESYPVASKQFDRTVSLPIFSSMTTAQIDKVVAAVRGLFS